MYLTMYGELETKRGALDAVLKVCRTPTTLFQFVELRKTLFPSPQNGLGKGWSRRMRKTISKWYNEKDPSTLAYQVTKYRNREGWTHRDLLRLVHLKPVGPLHEMIIRYIVTGELPSPEVSPVSGFLHATERAKLCRDSDELISLIREFGLVREHIPTEMLMDVGVWSALLERMPLTAVIRNLGKMTSIGVLKPLGDSTSLVCERLGNQKYLKKARIHPINLLVALMVYRRGKGFRSSLS